MRSRENLPISTQIEVQIESDADLYLSICRVLSNKANREVCIVVKRQTNNRNRMKVLLNKAQLEDFIKQLQVFKGMI